MHFRRVFKNATVAGVGIICSRILGFVRDILFASILGTGEIAQAFLVAFRIPNLLRDILAEGAANSAIIPVLVDYKKRVSSKEYSLILDSLRSVMIFSLTLFVLIGISFTPYIVILIAPGFKASGTLFDLTVFMTRTMFPFLLFVGFYGVNMGILHADERFISTAMGQPFFNLVMIGSLLYIMTNPSAAVEGLIAGVLMGGIALISAQTVELHLIGRRFRMVVFYLHPAVKQMGRLLLPRLMGTVIYQINIFADTILASLSNIVGPGGIPAIYYANRLMQFPLAIFSISVSQAVLARLSHLHGKTDEIRDTFSRSLELVFFLIVPSAVFLMATSRLVVTVLFKRGAFDDYSVAITSSVLMYYAAGLIFFAGIKMLVAAFHSMRDTITPVRTAKISLVVNILLDIFLMFPMKIAGLALASAIAGGVNFVLLLHILNRRIEFINRRLVVELVKIILSGCIIFILLKWHSYSMDTASLRELLRAILLTAGGYLIGCGLFRIRIWRSLVNSAVKKFIPNPYDYR